MPRYALVKLGETPRPLPPPASNAAFIQREIAWFRGIIDQRFLAHAEGKEPVPFHALPLPDSAEERCSYADFVRRFDLGPAERLLVILALLPHVQPSVLDPFLIQNRTTGRRFTEFGGATGVSHGGFLPTGETAMFLLAGDDIAERLRHRALFRHDHRLYTRGVLRLGNRQGEEPALASVLSLTPEYVEQLVSGESYNPPLSPEFPAQRITTLLDWEDLVLDAPTRQELEDIITWIVHEDTLLDGWSLRRRLKPGFRSLFHGPPGTGKTLSASLLGKVTGLPVYRIDLSKIISKYIGETEKNMAALFDQADNKRWILFFDEADSLFGKRTESRNANDRAANQQVAYLLQRIEDFAGVVILASNLQSHIDEAFARRFQSMVFFRMPTAEERLRLWEDCFKDKPYRLAPDVDLRAVARAHELSGGSIINVLRYACLRAVARGEPEVRHLDITSGIRRELHKEGKFST